AVDDHHLTLERLERLENGRKREVVRVTRRRKKALEHGAARAVHDEQALGRCARFLRLQWAEQQAEHAGADAGGHRAARTRLSENRSVHATAFHYCASRLTNAGEVRSAL